MVSMNSTSSIISQSVLESVMKVADTGKCCGMTPLPYTEILKYGRQVGAQKVHLSSNLIPCNNLYLSLGQFFQFLTPDHSAEWIVLLPS